MPAILFFLVLALAAGACLPTQAGINAHLNLWTRSPVLAAAISFAVGTMVLILYALARRVPLPALTGLSAYPWWIWSGGCLGAFFVTTTVILAPRLGAAPMLAFIVAGQMLASLLLDHFGLLGYPVQPITPWRLAGAVMVVGGAVLTRFA
ncbi:MAG: DMT family transporter [Deltaproteobacteria bacterium]|nr:DMT family transporter [Deltaproteobacteria bacterium]